MRYIQLLVFLTAMTDLLPAAQAEEQEKPIETAIIAKLRDKFSPLHLQVTNTSPKGSETMFQALIVSDSFASKPLLQRHRMVNDALQELLSRIEAFEMKTWTPDQWTKHLSKGQATN